MVVSKHRYRKMNRASPFFKGIAACAWARQAAAIALLAALIPSCALPATAGPPETFPGLGARDALVVADAQGRLLLAHNPHTRLVPASTLKILTALAALHYLGRDYRFPTDFAWEPPQNDLWITGYGDPLLVSETIAAAARELAERLPPAVHDIVLDARYFRQPLVVPGVSASDNPYDAPNGALCANFNTVYFTTQGGRRVSAEPQTPLLPWVRPRVQASGLSEGRIVLTHRDNDAARYAGELFRHFLSEAGIQVQGRVRLAGTATPPQTPRYRQLAPDSMEAIIARLLEHSNNFMANQLLIASGAAAYGPPGDLDKGARALRAFATEKLGIRDAVLMEGSGISRANRIAAAELLKAVAAFAPHRHLLRRQGGEAFKTGTLQGIRTRAGFLDRPDGDPYRFVLFLNTPGKSPGPVMRQVKRILSEQPPQGVSPSQGG